MVWFRLFVVWFPGFMIIVVVVVVVVVVEPFWVEFCIVVVDVCPPVYFIKAATVSVIVVFLYNMAWICTGNKQ